MSNCMHMKLNCIGTYCNNNKLKQQVNELQGLDVCRAQVPRARSDHSQALKRALLNFGGSADQRGAAWPAQLQDSADQ